MEGLHRTHPQETFETMRRLSASQWLKCNIHSLKIVHDDLKLGILILTISGCDTDISRLCDPTTIVTIGYVYGYDIAISRRELYFT